MTAPHVPGTTVPLAQPPPEPPRPADAPRSGPATSSPPGSDRPRSVRDGRLASDWYKDAVLYELNIRSFQDSDGDGVGDLPGLTQRLGYLKDLGVTALWLLPFYPSPLRDGGYDVSDHTAVHPDYGSLDDFRHFLKAAHDRDLRVIIELVLNHTSDRHEWFQRARRAPPGSPERDFYVWSDTPDRYADARVIFQDLESSNWTWDPVAGAYYWHRFYSHQPDLNHHNPAVQTAMLQALDFWLEMGVDGVRLDAVPYLFEREGTPCENLPETHAYLRRLRHHVDTRYGDRMLMGEANQWPEDAAAYFGDADECHAAFHFPLMPRLFLALETEDRFPVLHILQQTPDPPDHAQWLLFLRNHDELTLEMVTDEERELLLRGYGHDPRAHLNLGIRRRLMPLLGNDRRRWELMHGILLSLPGTPVLYYGDEIGMGDNHHLDDRDGVRTPMQWSNERNAGFSTAEPQRLYPPVVYDPEYDPASVNVESQLQNPRSALHWIRDLLAVRRRSPAFGRGTLCFLHPANPKILAFLREHQGQQILVVANLSRHAQATELDLAKFQGRQPVELSGQHRFATIKETPYPLSLGPHGFYWFQIPPVTLATDPPRLTMDDWNLLDHEAGRTEIEQALHFHMDPRHGPQTPARRILQVRLTDHIPLQDPNTRLVLFDARPDHGPPTTHALLLSWRTRPVTDSPDAAFPLVATVAGSQKILVDATGDPDALRNLLDHILQGRHRQGTAGTIHTTSYAPMPTLRPAASARILALDQAHATVAFDDHVSLRLLRSLEESPHPDLEWGLHLDQTEFPNAPRTLAQLEYRPEAGPPKTLALLHAHAPDAADAWTLTLDHLAAFFQHVQAKAAPLGASPPTPRTSPPPTDIPEKINNFMEKYMETMNFLGRRTAELHVHLASAMPAHLAPEPFTPFAQRALFQSHRTQIHAVLPILKQHQDQLSKEDQLVADHILDCHDDLLAHQRRSTQIRLSCPRIRVHGDLHLGQVLHTNHDVLFTHSGSRPGRLAKERHIKRSPLHDVASMLRSLRHAATHAHKMQVQAGSPQEADAEPGQQWGRLWTHWAKAAYLQGYLPVAKAAALVPTHDEDLQILLDALILEQTILDLGHALDERPDQVGALLHELLEQIDQKPSENRPDDPAPHTSGPQS